MLLVEALQPPMWPMPSCSAVIYTFAVMSAGGFSNPRLTSCAQQEDGCSALAWLLQVIASLGQSGRWGLRGYRCDKLEIRVSPACSL